jgi:hypothetical protein
MSAQRSALSNGQSRQDLALQTLIEDVTPRLKTDAKQRLSDLIQPILPSYE